MIARLLRPGLWLPLVLLAAAGCRTNYVIETTGGSKILTASRPREREGFYVWKDARGDEQQISRMRVREIWPATREDMKDPGAPSSSSSPRRW
ncbi:MAG TPA: YgdI/YgdR family lipoprotein [Verrucomicrobiota bacterium]|nr:YgdI/YgdR family lipoprotein [Verrucomicrobiota bacterium]